MENLKAYSKKYNYVIKWNAKSGCTMFRQLFLYLHKDELNIPLTNQWHEINKDFPFSKSKFNNNYDIPILHLVRNPYTRCVSMFCNKYIIKGHNILYNKINIEKNTFNEFSNYLLECKDKNHYCDIHILPQSNNYHKNDIIIKLESFEEDILNFYKNFNNELYEKVKVFLSTANIKSLFINKTNYYDDNYFCGNKSFNIEDNIFPEYKYFYNEEIQNNILNAYADDFKLYNYSSEFNFPNHLNNSN
jgi:hypothetical protein